MPGITRCRTLPSADDASATGTRPAALQSRLYHAAAAVGRPVDDLAAPDIGQEGQTDSYWRASVDTIRQASTVSAANRSTMIDHGHERRNRTPTNASVNYFIKSFRKKESGSVVFFNNKGYKPWVTKLASRLASYATQRLIILSCRL